MLEFYRAELEAMMKAQGKKRILPTDDQRRVLAEKGKSLSRKALMKMTITRKAKKASRPPWEPTGFLDLLMCAYFP
jgi:hypothetical protein